MGCAHSRLRTKVNVRDLESLVRTGDILLFSSKHAAAHVTKCFTASAWDHCGVVVKFSPQHVFILEYAGGVFLYPLFTRLYTYFAIQGRAIHLRRLLPGQDRAEMQRKVERFTRSVLGHKPPSIEEMVVAVLKQESLISSFIATLKGSGDEEKPAVECDLSTLFCSKLIAAVYKQVGLLAPYRASSDFLPKHFSAEYDGYLDLQNGALLGPELPVNFDSVQEEVDALREQVDEENRRRPEQIVAAISRFYLSATQGLGSLGTEINKSFMNLERGLHGYSADADAAMAKVGGGAWDPAPLPAGAEEAAPSATASAAETPGRRPSAGAAVQSSGGVQVQGGGLVRDVLNVHDGGIYSPPKAGAHEGDGAEAEGRRAKSWGRGGGAQVEVQPAQVRVRPAREPLLEKADRV